MRRLILAAVLAGVAAGAHGAGELVVYRCVAADGSVTLQNDQRCPKGSREQRRVVELPAPVVVPLPVARPVAVASEPVPMVHTAPDAPSPPPAEPTPAPPLFACTTWDRRRYLGDDAAPAPRCAVLRTVGLDGQDSSGVAACEMRQDQCEALPEAARCAGWAERRRMAEARLVFPGQADAAQARAELDRVAAAIAGSVCDS